MINPVLPGPWAIFTSPEQTTGSGKPVWMICEEVVDDGRGESPPVIAWVNPDHPDAQKNLALIAVAPDLLLGARQVLNIFERITEARASGDQEKLDKVRPDMWDAIRLLQEAVDTALNGQAVKGGADGGAV